MSNEIKGTARFFGLNIERLDQKVFPQNQIEVVLLPNEPEEEGKRLRYCSGSIPLFLKDIVGKNELYLIFAGGWPGWLRKQKEKRMFFFNEEDLLKAPEECAKFFLFGIVIKIAAHEVRHRFQKYFPKEVFKPTDIEKLENPYLTRLFEYTSLLCKEIYLDTLSREEYRREFDAAIIEHLALKELIEHGLDYDRIAEIVMTKRKVFLGEN
jgi:hypothetical protein